MTIVTIIATVIHLMHHLFCDGYLTAVVTFVTFTNLGYCKLLYFAEAIRIISHIEGLRVGRKDAKEHTAHFGG